MKSINIHDFIVPTSPIAALVLGSIITIIVSVVVYVETKELKVSLYTTLISVSVLSTIVFMLYQFGFYK